MGRGMVREVDRAIGAISAILVGLGVIMLRGFLRGDRDGKDRNRLTWWPGSGQDEYYQKKYGAQGLPLFQHRGSCACGSLQFRILAPKRIEAFDDSNTLSCKKGRFPFLLVPITCFDMVQSTEVSVYEPPATTTQHIFCGNCGIHIFHVDHTTPDVMAVNLYCLEDDRIEDVKIIFVPKGSRAVFGTPRPQPIDQAKRIAPPLQTVGDDRDDVKSDITDLSASGVFQRQLMMWTRLPKNSPHAAAMSDDTQSSSPSGHSQPQRYPIADDDHANLLEMKQQLEYYLKRHLDEPSKASNEASV